MRTKRGGKAIIRVRKHAISRGVWGHAPPGIFLHFRLPETGIFLENSIGGGGWKIGIS
jgi:hypothetical protein